MEDIRWREVYGIIRKVTLSEELTYQVEIRVRFDGELYTSRLRFNPEESDVRDILDACVTGIDHLMEENGVHPYKIASVE